MGNERRDAAVKLLRHYLVVAFKHADLKWTNDNDVEVADIVDDIIAAAREPVQSDHAKNVQALLNERLSRLEDQVDRALTTPKDSTDEHGLV